MHMQCVLGLMIEALKQKLSSVYLLLSVLKLGIKQKPLNVEKC